MTVVDKFSDRVGATRKRSQLQIAVMDSALRNALWNWLCWALEKETRSGDTWGEEYWFRAAKGGLWDEVFHLPEDEVKTYGIHAFVKNQFISSELFDVYNLIEWVFPRVNHFRGQYDRRSDVVKELNGYLEREMSGYRAIGTQIVPITSPSEIAAIEEASRAKSGFAGVAEHIDSALTLLGKKPEPDYRNSIKESVSAVEAVAKLLTGEKSGGIDKAIAILERKGALHPSF
jgi:AbiJ N-terminal domain 4